MLQSDFLYNKCMKEVLKQIIDSFTLGYTGRLGNIIDFQNYKNDKLVRKYCNNKISAILIIIILAYIVYYYFS